MTTTFGFSDQQLRNQVEAALCPEPQIQEHHIEDGPVDRLQRGRRRAGLRDRRVDASRQTLSACRMFFSSSTTSTERRCMNGECNAPVRG